MAAPTETLIVGCGNLLRGDDAAGPVLVRILAERGVPDHVRLVDGGTAGMDIAFAMRGARRVVIVDAARSGTEPGTVFRVPGEEVAADHALPAAGNLHAFRWDHALAFGRWLLKDEYPSDVEVWLVEGASFQLGDELSESVRAAVEALADRLLDETAARAGA